VGQPEIENGTPFAFAPVFLADEEGRPLLVPLVKATFAIGPRGLSLAEVQRDPALAGEAYGDPAETSWRYEPEGLLPKPATDVVLVGSAVAPRPGTSDMLVAFQVGPVRKGVRVLGDRAFFRAVGGVGLTRPVPFERMPLVWERAFGGWDRSHPDPARHACEPRNTVGTGFRGGGGRFEEGLRAPNLEDPARPLKGFGDRPPPAGFGFTSPGWEPRTKLAGTYDQRWEKERAPLLPLDFDPRFLQGAPAGQVAPGHLRGDEQVVVSGATAGGGLSFRLPGVPPPRVRAALAAGPGVRTSTALDTVIVDTDAGLVFLLWRGRIPLREGPHDVRALVVEGAAPAAAAAV
jgi:hypothetical protein